MISRLFGSNVYCFERGFVMYNRKSFAVNLNELLSLQAKVIYIYIYIYIYMCVCVCVCVCLCVCLCVNVSIYMCVIFKRIFF